MVRYWLSAEGPTEVENTVIPFSPVQKFYSTVRENRVEVVFSLLDAARVSLGLFSIDGRAVVPMSVKDCQAGLNSIQLNGGRALAQGVYIVRLNDGAASRSLYLATITK